MESRNMRVFLVLAVLGVIGLLRAEAQSPPATSGSGCSNSIMSLSPCLSYITSNLTNGSPTQACCSALASVVKTSVTCLCTLFTSNNALGFPINQTRALSLPGACKITTPPLSKCNESASPAPSPVASPKAGSAAAPKTAPPAEAPTAESPKTGVNIPKPISPARSPVAAEGPTSVTSSANLGIHSTSLGATVALVSVALVVASSGFLL